MDSLYSYAKQIYFDFLQEFLDLPNLKIQNLKNKLDEFFIDQQYFEEVVIQFYIYII